MLYTPPPPPSPTCCAAGCGSFMYMSLIVRQMFIYITTDAHPVRGLGREEKSMNLYVRVRDCVYSALSCNSCVGVDLINRFCLRAG
mmetsp:Transcript_30449/g.34707  ORF Transcript_30449/g.34707 Transcript_30449/m.34707 type:complete len:86 (+) Transcript_30449:401-658(+)